jgi:uncharacterized protein YqgV (UPF0045/DUF77 family)
VENSVSSLSLQALFAEYQVVPVPTTEADVVAFVRLLLEENRAAGIRVQELTQRVSFLEGVIQHLRAAVKELSILL